jgi:murein L,D-transpeptidase YcbB/YkuD
VGSVSPGGRYAGVAGLAARLRLLGDLPESVTISADSQVYEGPLVDAVKHFQARFGGLLPTGELDYKTVVELNVPLSDRIEQMRLGLERYRWLPYKFAQPPVVINVPEFRLYGFTAGGDVDISMRVNVGEDYNHQTPMFQGNIQYMIFRPYWTPTPNILKKEIIPAFEKNPSLDQAGFELVGEGKVIKTGDVTPAMLQQIRAGRLSVRQPPGPENGMGLVKFMFPNSHDVYIHDTPASFDMFSKAAQGEEGELQRVASHGCIHVEYPDKFAAWLLRNTPGWDLAKVQRAMHEGTDNSRVNLTPAVPVVIFYMTVVAEENGDVHFFHDIYDHDRALKLELAQGYPYPK